MDAGQYISIYAVASFNKRRGILWVITEILPSFLIYAHNYNKRDRIQLWY